MQKRSLSLAGHKTSLALEPQFWEALEEMAEAKNTSVPALIARIDTERQTENLSSAVRLAVLLYFRRLGGC
jgi:predicted DNA-binding ribbon-helix-helix protein